MFNTIQFSELAQKNKELALTLVDMQEKNFDALGKAWVKFAGSDYATYTWGYNIFTKELANGARKAIEEVAKFTTTGNTK